MEETILKTCVGFDWNFGNQSKSVDKHGVLNWECEQMFFNKPLLLEADIKHSALEQRYYALGKTDARRKLFVAFTIRDHHIRVISARPMSKKERHFYEKF